MDGWKGQWAMDPSSVQLHKLTAIMKAFLVCGIQRQLRMHNIKSMMIISYSICFSKSTNALFAWSIDLVKRQHNDHLVTQ